MWDLKKGYSELIYNTEVQSDGENQHVCWDGGGLSGKIRIDTYYCI